MQNNRPLTIIICFKDAINKLKTSFIDQNLPPLPGGWITRVVFDSMWKNGPSIYVTEEIQKMCWEIVESWYCHIETTEEEFFTSQEIVAMIQLRVTQYQQEIENTLNLWGVLENNQLNYQLKEFVHGDDAVFTRMDTKRV